MKHYFVLALGLVFLVTNAFAGPEVIATQKARNIRDQNNASQGVPPAQSSPPAAAPNPPAAPSGPQGISQSQQQSIDKLQADLAAIKAGSKVTAEARQQLAADCMNLAKGAAKPSKALVTKLADDLSAALADKGVTVAEPAQLAKEINIVVNSGRLTATQAQTFIKAAQESLKASGVSAQAAQTVGNDLAAIATDLQKSKPKLYQ
jgi:alanyl-tRNA synthetase